jgi:DNA invertase Pin-like site-specific DNA recombinase
MTSIIYCRISSIAQNEYNKSVSLYAQEQICSKFAYENKLRVKAMYKEIHTAYNKIPKILNEIINKKGKTILISSIDRYSRNVEIGIKIAAKAIKNRNKFIFIQEKFICKSMYDLMVLKKFLQNTAYESASISNRTKNTRSFLINNGMFAGGYIPYGYNVVERRLVPNDLEQKIITFIKTCRKDYIMSDDLNKQMLAISGSPETINCYDGKNNIVKHITQPLTLMEISDILNSFGVQKRGSLWCPRVLNTAIKPYNPKVDLGDITLLKYEITSNKLNIIPNKHLDPIVVKSESHVRRSSRLNTSLNIQGQLSNLKPTQNECVISIPDLELFKQFTKFQNFCKMTLNLN